MNPSTVAKILGAANQLSIGLLEQTPITSFAIEPQLVQPGSLFFALSQPDYAQNFFNSDLGDSNPWIPVAFRSGAQICVTRRDSFHRYRDLLAPFANRLILVDDTIRAMQKLANVAFQASSLQTVGVTGSAGKTTTKDMIGHVLRCGGFNPLVSERNHNNGIGVSLTLLGLASAANYDSVVLEMGMSSPGGEIARLCEIAAPNIGVVLNVLPVHLQHLGSIQAIAAAKFELVENLAPQGIAVLNGDDAHVISFRERTESAIIFAERVDADIRANEVICERFSLSFTLCTPKGSTRARLPFPGRHNLSNALAAAAVAHLHGMAVSDVSAALATFRPPAQRGTVYRLKNGSLLVDDSYNSNPVAFGKAVEMSGTIAGPQGRVIVVAGEMSELGVFSRPLHYHTGLYVARYPVRLLATVGDETAHLIEGFRTLSNAPAIRCRGLDEIVSLLASEIKPNDVILIKGSRYSRLERITRTLLLRFGSVSDVPVIRASKNVRTV